MKNDKLDSTTANAIVRSTEGTTELIPEPTARLVEKSFAENTLRNRGQALKHFDEWLRGCPIADGLLAQYITDLFNEGKAPRTISITEMAVEVSQQRCAGRTSHYFSNTGWHSQRGSRPRARTTKRTHVA